MQSNSFLFQKLEKGGEVYVYACMRTCVRTQKQNPSTSCLNYDYRLGSLKDNIFLLEKFKFKKMTYEKQNS